MLWSLLEPFVFARLVDTYWINYYTGSGTMNSSAIAAVVAIMQYEIMTYGPVTVSINVYANFQNWLPSQGMLQTL